MAGPEELSPDQQILATALASPVPRFYFNGFVIGQSLSDVAVVGQSNGAPVAIVNLSFTTAKTLAHDLNALIAKFEEQTGHTIQTMHDFHAKSAGQGTR